MQALALTADHRTSTAQYHTVALRHDGKGTNETPLPILLKYPQPHSSSPDLRDNIHTGRDGGRETNLQADLVSPSDESAAKFVVQYTVFPEFLDHLSLPYR
ncbi:hypothetical protein V494_05588 [Pseudogymnoascus sp. VKM F-4513 (FW-928)]|nr:hypothetical protein V494_05588 [Pseudogymnoascus sp. VKM F-4513 (FW-928)]